MGLFTENGDHYFALTPLGATLKTGAPGGRSIDGAGPRRTVDVGGVGVFSNPDMSLSEGIQRGIA